MRKVIQISVLPTSQLYALCDDGSLWFSGNANWGEWNRIKDVPQPVGEEEMVEAFSKAPFRRPERESK